LNANLRHTSKVFLLRIALFFLCALLSALPRALAQADSGTIVVINFAKDEVVVAADSRAIRQDTGVPDNSYCKVAVFRHQFIFASVGASRFLDQATGRILWDNNDLARQAARASQSHDRQVSDLYAAAVDWAQAVKSHWDANREDAKKIPGPRGGQITAGEFMDKSLAIEIGEIRFDAENKFDPIRENVGLPTDDRCWPCSADGQTSRICVAGKHADVAKKFCAQKRRESKSEDRISVRAPLKAPTQAAELATKIVELTIDAYEKTAGDVGGPVDVVSVSRDGTVTWHARKSSCPENQD
jgi:hypothetical protein